MSMLIYKLDVDEDNIYTLEKKNLCQKNVN